MKTVNNTAGANGFIPILLIFGLMLKITSDLALLSSQIYRVKVIDKIIIKLRKLKTKR